MNRGNRACAGAAWVAYAAGVAAGQTATFENNVNLGGWEFGGPNEFLAPGGGNPGGYLRSEGLDTTIPWVRCWPGSVFTGNFRAAGVSIASADVNVFSTDFNIGPFPLTVVLHSDNGTPANFDDDWAVFKKGDAIPMPGTGWKHVSFAIPSASMTLPAGWGYLQYGASSPPSANWNAVITNVTRLEFSFGDPELFYIFQQWTVGVDNIGLTVKTPCYPNCDGSTGTPRLTANDFTCFINAYANGQSYANCDGSTGVPMLTGNDFICFVTGYAMGCT